MAHEPIDPRFTPLHEAGHAVAAIILGFHLKGVDCETRSLGPGIVSGGQTDVEELDPVKIINGDRDLAVRRIMQIMAGPYAELKDNPRAVHQVGAARDLEESSRIAAFAICGVLDHEGKPTLRPDCQQFQQQIVAFELGARAKSKKLVEDRIRQIRLVEAALKDRGVLTGEEVAEIIQSYTPPASASAETEEKLR